MSSKYCFALWCSRGAWPVFGIRTAPVVYGPGSVSIDHLWFWQPATSDAGHTGDLNTGYVRYRAPMCHSILEFARCQGAGRWSAPAGTEGGVVLRDRVKAWILVDVQMLTIGIWTQMIVNIVRTCLQKNYAQVYISCCRFSAIPIGCNVPHRPVGEVQTAIRRHLGPRQVVVTVRVLSKCGNRTSALVINLISRNVRCVLQAMAPCRGMLYCRVPGLQHRQRRPLQFACNPALVAGTARAVHPNVRRGVMHPEAW